MNFPDLFGYAFHHLRHRGLRTWLTLLGIVVGISSVILLVGLVDGLSSSIDARLSQLGSDIITISPGGTAMRGPPGEEMSSSADKLYMKDAEIVKGVNGVQTVSPSISVTVNVTYRDHSSKMTVTGVDTENYLETNVLGNLSEGRYLENGDKGAVLLSSSVVDRTFNGQVRVNSRVELDGKAYRVIGILAEDNGGTGGGFGGGGFGGRVYLPIDDARELAGTGLANDEVTRIQAKMAKGYNLTTVSDNINWALMQAHQVTEDNKDFTVMSPTFMEEQRATIMGTLTIFLGLVSAVSLIVGGIGISNTMFMSVLERTREIGVLKALGATSSQIRDMFLMESAMIGLAGGILGIAAGWVFIQIAATFGYAGVISAFMVGLSFAVSVGIGIIAGTYPAEQATKVPAVEALRYE